VCRECEKNVYDIKWVKIEWMGIRSVQGIVQQKNGYLACNKWPMGRLKCEEVGEGRMTCVARWCGGW
jgi:hypothetical protein